MPQRTVERLILFITLVLISLEPCSSKRRNAAASPHATSVHKRKRECEDQCAGVAEDDQGNCVLKCQSSACYEEIYLPEELEPGEIDHKRYRAFQNCINAEQRKLDAERRRGRVKPSDAASNSNDEGREEGTDNGAATTTDATEL